MFQVRLPQDTAGEVALRSLRLRGIFLPASKISANQMTKAAISIIIKSTSYHAK